MKALNVAGHVATTWCYWQCHCRSNAILNFENTIMRRSTIPLYQWSQLSYFCD